MMIFLASICVIDPSGLVTSTRTSDKTLPLPTIDSTLFAVNNAFTPYFNFFTILSFVFIIVCMCYDKFSRFMP